jgi:hypothetical protein
MITAKITNVLVSLIALSVVAMLTGVVVLTALAATGDVGEAGGCRSEVANTAGEHEVRGVNNDNAVADAWQAKWEDFDAKLDAGQSATVSFTESEMTSRAQRYLDSKEAPLKDVRVCFHDGWAEATASVDLPILADLPGIGDSLDTNVRAAGTMDFEGVSPRIVITEVEAGNLPAEASERLKGRIEDAVNDRIDDLFFQHSHSATFTEGSVEVSGQP